MTAFAAEFIGQGLNQLTRHSAALEFGGHDNRLQLGFGRGQAGYDEASQCSGRVLDGNQGDALGAAFQGRGRFDRPSGGH